MEVDAAEKYDIEGQEQYFGIGESREGKHIYTSDFATSFGGSRYEYIQSIAAIEDGGYIVGGRFESSSMQVGDYTLTNNGSYDAYLVKYDRNNEVEWASSLGGSASEEIYSIAETEDGGYIVGGYYNSSSMQVGDYTLSNNGDSDAFLVKYNRNNEVEWASSLGGTSYDEIYSIAVTEDGGYIVGGRFYITSMQVGDYTLTNKGSYDAYLVKYGRNNEVEWASSFGGTADDNIYSVESTEDGGYIVGGYFTSSSMQVGDTTLNSNGRGDVFVAKYDRNNEVEWASSFGGISNDDRLTSIALTEDGGYIVGGYFYSSRMQVGDYTLTNKGNSDAFLVKYDRNNEVEWASSFGGTNYEYLYSIAVTEDGGYIVGGQFNSSNMQLGNYTLTRNGGYDAYLVKYDINNEVEWASSFGETSYERIQSIAATEDGGYIVGGYYNSSSMQLGDYTLTNKGNYDTFIAKYKPKEVPEVVYKDARQIGGINAEYLSSIAETEDGGYIVGGRLDSSSMQVGDYTLTKNGSYSDVFLVKYDRNNGVEWASSFGGDSNDYLTSIEETEDGGYIVGGYF